MCFFFWWERECVRKWFVEVDSFKYVELEHDFVGSSMAWIYLWQPSNQHMRLGSPFQIWLYRYPKYLYIWKHKGGTCSQTITSCIMLYKFDRCIWLIAKWMVKRDGYKNSSRLESYCWWTKILHQLIWEVSHYLQGFLHSRWCRVHSINSMFESRVRCFGGNWDAVCNKVGPYYYYYSYKWTYD